MLNAVLSSALARSRTRSKGSMGGQVIPGRPRRAFAVVIAGIVATLAVCSLDSHLPGDERAVALLVGLNLDFVADVLGKIGQLGGILAIDVGLVVDRDSHRSRRSRLGCLGLFSRLG